jgi:hypothetical protein
MGQQISPRVYDLGTLSATKKLSELAITRKIDNQVIPVGGSAPIRIGDFRSVMLHVIVSNASSLNADLTAYVMAAHPDDFPSYDFSGAKYDGGSSDINITADGEYILDITDTAANCIDPTIEINAGSGDFVLFVCGNI